MKIKTILVRVILLLTLLFLPTSAAFAQTPGGDVVLFGQNYTLESGDELNGSLAVFGGNVNIEEDAKVNGDVALIGGNLSLIGNVDGDVALIGGNLTISGAIDGDIVIVGGQVLLTKTAVVNGDISTIGGNVEKEPGAEVTGNITNNAPPTINVPQAPNVPNIPQVPGVPATPEIDVNVNPFWNVAGKFGQALLVALAGMLLALFLQPQLERAGDAMTGQPFIAGSYGLMAIIIVPVAAVIMAVTLILFPVSLLVIFLVMPSVWLFGMVALGQEVGDRFTKAINQSWAPVLSTGFGTFLLMLVVGLVGLIPCVGWLSSFLVTLIAIGGVGMTWFGTRNAPGARSHQVDEIPPAS
ncbi:MAG: polymer-forming cytoskeletal protein [Chloroflexi bacterium]|nr:polymer-forming cytoskeletal protein [Chloroflexota bacterium]